MADRTAETRNGRSEAAVAETSHAPAAKPASSSNPWLPLIITVVLMPALAFAMTRFVLVPQMKQALSKTGAASAELAPARYASGKYPPSKKSRPFPQARMGMSQPP